jgi:hypothetical protein
MFSSTKISADKLIAEACICFYLSLANVSKISPGSQFVRLEKITRSSFLPYDGTPF